jgi:hypothetical protein
VGTKYPYEQAITCRLERYDASTNPDFAKALSLYKRTVPWVGQTNTNEITYWVDRKGQIETTAEAHCFGYSINGDVIGFAHCGVLKQSNFAFLDYIALREDMREPAWLAGFFSKLTQAVKSAGVRFVMTEVLSDKALTKFCRLEGFQEIVAPYFQPPLGKGEAIPATLMVLGFDGQLTTDTYVKCVEEIYRGYYQPWHKPFLTTSQAQEHAFQIDALLRKIRDSAGCGNLELKGGGLACLKENWC